MSIFVYYVDENRNNERRIAVNRKRPPRSLNSLTAVPRDTYTPSCRTILKRHIILKVGAVRFHLTPNLSAVQQPARRYQGATSFYFPYLATYCFHPFCNVCRVSSGNKFMSTSSQTSKCRVWDRGVYFEILFEFPYSRCRVVRLEIENKNRMRGG